MRRLGAGGMSTVWLAEDQKLGRQVALKILRSDLQDPGLAKRLQREAALLAKLESPYIVPVYESGTLPSGEPWIAMKYVAGKTLDQVGELSIDSIRSIYIQILRGIDAAHQVGIIHRDLKPSNILLDEEGNAYLLDFGVARDIYASQDLTETGTIIGTAHYLSPEQAHGEAATEQSDLYALGIMLYQSLTGRHPWPGTTSISLAVQQATETSEPPSRYRKDVDPRLDKTVLRAIAYRKDLRFQSAEEFIDALSDRSPLRKSPFRFLWVLVPVMLLGGWFLWQSGERQVPDLRGLSLLEARQELSKEDLRWYSRNIYSPLPRGQIVRTAPSAGTALRQGSVVVLWISRGPRLFAVPDVEGEAAEIAETLLAEAGLQGERRGLFSPLPKGTVVRTDPGAGSRLRADGIVILWVSRGRAPTRAPDCIDKTEEECREVSGALEVDTTYWSSLLPAGTIIDQFPKAGQKTDSLQIYVSLGKEVIEVPDIEGLALRQARKILQDLGLGVIIARQETGDPLLRNKVIEQSPLPGQEIDAGQEVYLQVGA